MEQAFHHIEPRDEFVRSLPAVLNEGGVVVIAESNAWNPLIQIRVLKLRGLKTVIEYETPDFGKTKWGHERILTPMALGKILRMAGFEVKRRQYFRLLPSNKCFDKFSWIESIWPGILFPAFTHYTVVAEKFSDR
jgi:hypothetical protein